MFTRTIFSDFWLSIIKIYKQTTLHPKIRTKYYRAEWQAVGRQDLCQLIWLSYSLVTSTQSHHSRFPCHSKSHHLSWPVLHDGLKRMSRLEISLVVPRRCFIDLGREQGPTSFNNYNAISSENLRLLPQDHWAKAMPHLF